MRSFVSFIAAISVTAGALGTSARADETPAAGTVLKVAIDDKPTPDGGIYVGWGGGLTPGTSTAGFGSTSLVIDRPLFWRLGLWVSGEAFYIAHPSSEDELALRLCIGVRVDVWRSENRKVRVIADVAFTHQHEATVSLWRDHFFDNLLGESKYGLGHRSGVEVGGGLLITPWIDSRVRGMRRVRVMVRASGAWLPDDNGPNFYLSLLTSVGVAL